ncbi:MAG: ammonium transporter [Marinomonas sp.]
MIARFLTGFLSLAAVPSMALAQESVPMAVSDSGDTAWILTSSALVLLMTLPGLALFYGGLVRSKNFLSVLIQCGGVAAIASVLWVVVGYTLAFGDVTNGWLGSGNAWMLNNLGNVRADTTMPESTFVLFQMTFAIITPALMIGAWVERASFGWVMGFCALWGLVIYAPVTHWIWGGGWLSQTFGTVDFAGGIVVHTTAGVSALVIAMLLGKRKGFPEKAMLPHAPGLTMVGAALLWVGWFGFNGGSAFAATDDASSAIINTHVAACSAALVWLLIEKFAVGKPTMVGWATGVIAGLATVTPAAGSIGPGAAILLGIMGSVICYLAIQQIKHRMGIDDTLDVFAVHGVGGMIGAIMVAVFMSETFGGVGYGEGVTMSSQFIGQLASIGIVAVWSAVGTAILALMVSMVFPMRSGKDEEQEGLDITSHGERAWELD